MRKYAAVLLILYSALINALELDDVVWITEEYPPYNFSENGVAKGISVDLLIEIWKILGLNKTRSDIHIYPWARGVKLLETRSSTCLFATTLTSERKNVLGWKFAYPIPQIDEQSENQIIAKKSKNIRFNSLQDLVSYCKNFGVVRGDIGASLLLEAGVNDQRLDKTSEPMKLAKKLDAERFEVISYNFETISTIMKQVNIAPNNYEAVYTFPPSPLGYAFHHSTDEAFLKRFQQALDTLHANGMAESILRKYVQE